MASYDFRRQHGRPALWELDSDQHFNVGRQGPVYVVESHRSITRSLSDVNIPSDFNFEQNEDSSQPDISNAQSNKKGQQNETTHSR
ncbi:hypothetical protein LIER_39083 [Lithospermum erythrorhizon]|uniref:Uncharacterized protein n=1 Tax=Lithospermum erythrorhizon TaxID=34254 RepID=A0AAV3QBY0_LITER